MRKIQRVKKHEKMAGFAAISEGQRLRKSWTAVGSHRNPQKNGGEKMKHNGELDSRLSEPMEKRPQFLRGLEDGLWCAAFRPKEWNPQDRDGREDVGEDLWI